jgi:uncharacterized protein YuzE
VSRFAFRISIETHDQTGQVIAAYFQIRKGKVNVTKEYADGAAFADYDKHGELLGIEMLAPCKVSVLDKIAQKTEVKRFVRGVVPRAMLVTA